MTAPWEAMPEVLEHPPPFLNTSMARPLRGDAGGLGAPTTSLEDVDGGLLGGDAGGPEVPPIYLDDVDCRLSKRYYDTSTGAATGAARCGSFIGNGFSLLVVSY
jgi:hypothetical protein